MEKPIEDTRIGLATAKLAKEKHYDAISKGSITEYITTQKDPEYPEGGGPFGWKKGELEGSEGYFRNFDGGSDYSNKNYIMYARPTQPVLQKWLREKHGIEVFVKPFYIPQLNREGCFKYYGLVVLKDCLGDCNASSDCKDKYEDAFEEALILALNLIKI
jgi:hypothetical protein